MKITFFDLLAGIIALISLFFNLFQLYREKINKQKLDDQKKLHETILLGLLQNMNEEVSSISQLSRKGINGVALAESVIRIVNAQRIEIAEFLKNYYNVEISKKGSVLGMLSSISEKGEKQKRSINIIEGEENATSVMIDSVEKAERYIFCVGGRSRNQAYLDALSQRVKQGDIRYIRIITGDHIRHQLCEHIRSIFQNIELGYLKEDKYGGIIATHDTVILALYSSRVPNLEKTLKINDEQIASDYRAYIQDLLNASEKPLDMNFILSLCTACRVNLKI